MENGLLNGVIRVKNGLMISNEKKDVTMILENKKVLDSTLITIKLIHNLNKATRIFIK